MARKKLEEEDDFRQWQQTYREQEAARGGRPMINGQPAPSLVNNNLVNPPVSPSANLPLVAQSVQSLQERYQTSPEALQARETASLNRYRSFLADQGADPDMIGNSLLVGQPGTNRTMVTPSRAEQEAASQLASQNQANRARGRIAARRLERRGDFEGAEMLRQNVDYAFPRMGRSANQNFNYWLNRLGSYDTRSGGLQGNGFSGPVSFDGSRASRQYGSFA